MSAAQPSETKSSLGTFMLAAILLIVLLLTSYVAGYFLLGESLDVGFSGVPMRIRVYQHAWLVSIYGPLAQLEWSLTGTETHVEGQMLFMPGNP